jgi:hypothetical protein
MSSKKVYYTPQGADEIQNKECSVAHYGAEKLIWVRHSSLWCGVAHLAVAKLIRVRCSSFGCGVAHLGAKKLIFVRHSSIWVRSISFGCG